MVHLEKPCSLSRRGAPTVRVINISVPKRPRTLKDGPQPRVIRGGDGAYGTSWKKVTVLVLKGDSGTLPLLFALLQPSAILNNLFCTGSCSDMLP